MMILNILEFAITNSPPHQAKDDKTYILEIMQDFNLRINLHDNIGL